MKKKLVALLLSLSLCLALMVPAFAASGEVIDSSTITVSVTELKPGYYLCAIWHGDTLLRLFDYTVGSDGKLEATIEIGEKLATGDQVTVGISNANTGTADMEPIPPIICTVKNTSSNNPTPPNPGTTAPNNPGYSNLGSTYTPPMYSITTPSVTGGRISISPASASFGSTVIVTATPDAGYELATLTVFDANGKTIDLTDRGNGQYSFKMPNGKVSVNAEFRLIDWNNPFTDVAWNAWYYDAVKYVNQNGLMNGVGNGLFAPGTNLSRAMLAEILYNKEGRPTVVSGSSFPDVMANAWYADAVAWAATKKIVGGYGNGLFGPGDDITREQFAVILYRYAGSPVPPNLLLDFTDAYKVSDWAQDAIRWAVDEGILNGKGNGILDPTGKATRAEAAQMLKNYLEK